MYGHVNVSTPMVQQWKFSCIINSLPNDMTKLKAFADYKLNVTRMMISLLNKVENTVGKEENAGYRIFSFSHNFFKSLLFQGR